MASPLDSPSVTPISNDPQDSSVLDYDLPAERIAAYPLEDRAASRLLHAIVTPAPTGKDPSVQVAHRRFRELPSILQPGTQLVFNNTRVIRARILMQKETGGAAEVFCLEPVGAHADPAVALLDRGESVWKCLIGGKKIGAGKRLQAFAKAMPQESERAPGGASLTAEVLERDGAQAVVKFSWTGEGTAQGKAETFAEVLERFGEIPIPPYLGRASEKVDQTRYQTVYARHEGSVAAPTAGLHFTPEVFAELEKRGSTRVELTLHVSAGTFRPVETSDIHQHPMHEERIEVPREALRQFLNHPVDRPRVAVGTTSARTLESLALWGERLLDEPGLLESAQELRVAQWSWKTGQEATGAAREARPWFESLKAVERWLDFQGLASITGATQLMITPGYRFRTIDGLITNFHQPKSTLIVLIAAVLGEQNWRRVYQAALDEGYRFLSYGDSSLLELRR
jgi:S-adenosylmethionine:tRNA ribosyltransferase-isomerase